MNNLEELEKKYAELGKEIEALKNPQHEYPIYCLLKKTGLIVKFNGLEDRIVVKNDKDFDIGYKYSIWIYLSHTNTDIWERLQFNKERGLYDTQLVEFWDDNCPYIRSRGFYNAKNDAIFSHFGGRIIRIYDNIIPVEGNWPEWAIEAHKTLKR